MLIPPSPRRFHDGEAAIHAKQPHQADAAGYGQRGPKLRPADGPLPAGPLSIHSIHLPFPRWRDIILTGTQYLVVEIRSFALFGIAHRTGLSFLLCLSLRSFASPSRGSSKLINTLALPLCPIRSLPRISVPWRRRAFPLQIVSVPCHR